MSRYGFSRSPISPYGAMPGIPHVNESDFSYITSQDLDDPTLAVPVDDLHHSRSYAPASPNPDDDVLIIKNRGIIYPAHFPAYSIGDGKLIVEDVRERVALLMDLPDKARRRIKLLYKGKQLRDSQAPVREYGCKNKSELLAVVPEDIRSGGGGDEGASSLSDEELVYVDDPRNNSKSKRKRQRRTKKKTGTPDVGSPQSGSASSPRDSNSAFEAPNSPSSVASGSGGANANHPAMKMLDELNHEFKTKWVPLCDEYASAPPADKKKRADEHRKLSESVLQHILLKLDGVETDGIEEIRSRRKDLVKRVQAVLKELDVAAKSGE